MKKAHYRKGYKYQLAKDLVIPTNIFPIADIVTQFIKLTTTGLLTLKSGYSSDGPSGPTIDTKSSMRGAFAHDGGYQLLRMGYLGQEFRKQFDQLAFALWTEDKMWKWRARRWYRALRKLGSSAADPKNVKKVYIAP